MYAVFQIGGKQYRVSIGQIVRLEKLNIAVGNTIEFCHVLMITNDNDINIGYPILNNSKIIGQVIAHGKNKKVIILKFHRRKHYRKYQGHRQRFTDVKIININLN